MQWRCTSCVGGSVGVVALLVVRVAVRIHEERRIAAFGRGPHLTHRPRHRGALLYASLGGPVCVFAAARRLCVRLRLSTSAELFRVVEVVAVLPEPRKQGALDGIHQERDLIAGHVEPRREPQGVGPAVYRVETRAAAPFLETASARYIHVGVDVDGGEETGSRRAFKPRRVLVDELVQRVEELVAADDDVGASVRGHRSQRRCTQNTTSVQLSIRK